MRTSAAQYIPLVEKSVFQGQPLYQVEHSIYRCNNLWIEMHASMPQTDVYFFEARLDRPVDMCLYICGHESLVVCLDPGLLRELNLSRQKDGKHYVFNLIDDHTWNGEAYLLHKKNSEYRYPINITEYAIPIEALYI